ncbi:hypothetical protein GUITHDRAFT_102810 [Guillardia theta CCMP2712]|uniref:Uncharacterized protein n=1 Tax=Guillardia theta (strain CCMP2712) TaxID=905079 RepID=L1JTY4_GUITC|nr:hypothetical protein GUITHDRAFT_102810 [Guillardia theta CCMP2712]EKX51548.1 hypothetical protein GUITHDRAFT_102810 [Guillardia theta CCMP2712]|eukprot:XP_005838528.1 hypothetical protein GUITHDRAFT_102810 [Guillardia theta CCMP2712]
MLVYFLAMRWGEAESSMVQHVPRPSCATSPGEVVRLRGGSMSDRWLDSAAEFWDIHTVPDDLESTLTMLMNREPPFIMIELWGASGGQFRTTYDMAGNDVVTVWPQGYTGNLTEWDNETLAEEMKKLSFAKPIGSNPFEIGSWVFRPKGPHILLTNKQQQDFEIYLTSKGFVFFDSSGYALVNQEIYFDTD